MASRGLGLDPGDDEFPPPDVAFTPSSAQLSPAPHAAGSFAPDPTSTPRHLRRHRSEPSFFGLPQTAQLLYKQRGVNDLYAWQREVLSSDAVQARKNFVYSMPTSGGKTLVAEVISMQTVHKHRQLALFVLPFVAIAEEKVSGLRSFAEALSFGVDGYYGTVGRFPAPRDPTIMVCTIEKATSVIHHLAEEGRLAEVGSCVVDELHMIGEGQRGAGLEVLLTKLLCFAPHCQIVGMSATIPNLPEIAEWLSAECVVGTQRPVPLEHRLVCGGDVLVDSTVERSVRGKGDPDVLLELVHECLPASVLVFCASRASCVETAKSIARSVRQRGGLLAPSFDVGAQLKALDQYEAVLADVASAGVAYHHAGLLGEERQIIEHGFCARRLLVVCCTSTLAAGVNLPARRVIIRSPYVGRDFLSGSMYRQMCGRAGRAGFDDRGESFLMIRDTDRFRAKCLMETPAEPTRSQLNLQDSDAVARIVMDTVAIGVCTHSDHAEQFVRRTLAARGDCTVDINKCLELLAERGMLVKEDTSLAAAGFGKASVKSCFSMEQANFVKSELLRVQHEGLILVHDLHVCYFLTPVHEICEPDWVRYQELLSRFTSDQQRIAERVGLNEHLVSQRAAGIQHPVHKHVVFAARRFYSAMMLDDLLKETPIHDVEAKFGVTRGQVQALMKSAAIFSSSICSFCASMEWYALEAVLVSFVKRLGYGVRPDLVPLMEIKGVTPARARALWAAGYKTAASIASESPEKLRDTVRKSNPSSKAIKFFTLRTATAIVREANGLVRVQIQERKSEIAQLSVRPTQHKQDTS